MAALLTDFYHSTGIGTTPAETVMNDDRLTAEACRVTFPPGADLPPLGPWETGRRGTYIINMGKWPIY